jgi:hypothetical protein
MSDAKEQFITQYISAHTPAWFRYLQAENEFAKQFRNLQSWAMQFHGDAFLPSKDYASVEWQKTRRELERQGAIAYDAEQAEKDRAERESERLFVEGIIATDADTGRAMSWSTLVGVKTLKTLVLAQLGVVDINAVRDPPRFINELSQYDNRPVSVDSLGKSATIKLRVRFPPKMNQ